MKNDILAVNAHLVARTGCEDQLKVRLEQLVRECFDHKGLLTYRLHQDYKNSAHFVFYEQFESREAFDRHMDSKELKSFQKDSRDLLGEEAKVYVLMILADHKGSAQDVM